MKEKEPLLFTLRILTDYQYFGLIGFTNKIKEINTSKQKIN